jgi:hypothetical protein
LNLTQVYVKLFAAWQDDNILSPAAVRRFAKMRARKLLLGDETRSLREAMRNGEGDTK